jgi:hypothetical protein
VLAEERVERAAEAGDVAHLAADDDPVLERLACDLDDARSAVVLDVGGGELRRADLDADELLVLRPRLGAAARRACARSRLRQLRLQVRKLDLLLQVDHL